MRKREIVYCVRVVYAKDRKSCIIWMIMRWLAPEGFVVRAYDER